MRVDRATGAVVRVVQTSTGNRIEVESAGLLVSRQVAATKVTTVIRDQRDELVVSFERGRLTVNSPAGRLSATPAQVTQMAAARRLIDAFPGSRKALSLINKLGFGPEVPVLPLLVTTRSFLQAVTISTLTPVDNTAFQRRVEATTGVRVTKVAFQAGRRQEDHGPITDRMLGRLRQGSDRGLHRVRRMREGPGLVRAAGFHRMRDDLRRARARAPFRGGCVA